MRWLLDARPGEEMPELVVNPDRPGRVEPRAKKRRHNKYGLWQCGNQFCVSD